MSAQSTSSMGLHRNATRPSVHVPTASGGGSVRAIAEILFRVGRPGRSGWQSCESQQNSAHYPGGSPRRGKIRTFLSLTVFAGSASAPRRQNARLTYHFNETESPSVFQRETVPRRIAKASRNPIVMAREWQDALDRGTCSSRADLAREFGVSRARVTQILGLLDLAPEVVHTVVGLGDPLHHPIVTERMLRPLLKLPVNRQMDALQAIVGKLA